MGRDNLSEEEKKAIENIEHITKHWQPPKEDELANIEYKSIKKLYEMYKQQQKEIEEKNITINKMAKDISIQLKEIEELKENISVFTDKKLKNIINKQQKEIEELKEKNKKQFFNYEKRVNELEYKQLNYISKDIIRAKIKEIENEHTGSTRNALSVLQELLED